ncbi:MAG: glycosyltransferase [Acidimicrobiales bacterium]
MAVVVPARDEALRLPATVAAARRLPEVGVVIVVDDGSSDATAEAARAAGALVVAHRRSRGKASAMETGAEVASVLDQHDGRSFPRHLLFLDADLEHTAANAAPLAVPVLAGAADMTIAVLPPAASAGGGHGFVVRLARRGIARRTGWSPTQPLSGQRCMSRACFEALRPLARGFGVETALTIDALARGLRVVEVEADLSHRVTGRDWRAQRHRARQYRDVALALAARRRRTA